MLELQKKEKNSDHSGSNMEVLARKVSKKINFCRNEFFEAKEESDSAPNSFKVVKVPLSKLAPLTMEKYR